MKRTWVNYGQDRDWESRKQGQGSEFLRESIGKKKSIGGKKKTRKKSINLFTFFLLFFVIF